MKDLLVAIFGIVLVFAFGLLVVMSLLNFGTVAGCHCALLALVMLGICSIRL